MWIESNNLLKKKFGEILIYFVDSERPILSLSATKLTSSSERFSLPVFVKELETCSGNCLMHPTPPPTNNNLFICLEAFLRLIRKTKVVMPKKCCYK